MKTNGNSRRDTLGWVTTAIASLTCSQVGYAATLPKNAGEAYKTSSHYSWDPATYFDLIEPQANSKKPPILLISGGGHTGSCFLLTADGRPGWAYRFAQRGYRVAVVDWPGTGRSGFISPEDLTGERVVKGLGKVLEALGEPAIVLTHSMSGAYGWKLIEHFGERIAKLIGVAPSEPGNIQKAPVVVKETDEAIEFQLFPGAATLNANKKVAFYPTRGFAEKKLVGSSKQFPREHLDTYAASLIAVPPRLIIERGNLGGSQLKVKDFSKFSGKRVLVVTGTDDIDHPVSVDKPIADWLNQNGAKADYMYLGDGGIVGNGHMMMMENNSDLLADFLISWIETK